MRAHQLDGTGKIINTIEVASLLFLPNLIDASVGGTIGDSWDGSNIIPKPFDTVTAKAEIQAQMDGLELKSLENRGAREFHLLQMEDIAQKLSDEALGDPTQAEILAANIYYTKLKALDTQIRALRDAYNAL